MIYLGYTIGALSYKFDNNGIRAKKIINGVDTEYLFVGDMLVSQKPDNEVVNFAYTACGAPYGFTYNGQSYFYLLNLQGDVIGIYDGNGNVVVEYTYDSWGKLISITRSLASTIGIKNPLRYRGYYYDTETSLYYLQSRYYDPETCRFLNADAFCIAGNDYIQGANMFSYCYNNPVMYSDLAGYEAYPATGDSAKMAATIAMVLALGRIGFSWWASIGELNYDNVYRVTEAVGNSINWFYDVYGLEVSLDNTIKLMSKITEMCNALSTVVGERAIDIMVFYFNEEGIEKLFAIHGEKINKKMADIESDLRINGGEFMLSVLAAGITTGIGFAISMGGVIYQLVDIMKIYEEYNLWKEIVSLNKQYLQVIQRERNNQLTTQQA